jgi:diguanylate cyclase (GGDEF)-like protein
MFGILFIDLDNFKEYNDRFGHLSGDEALKKLTAILKKNIRNIDTIGRYGGDEFIVLLVEAGVEKCENIAKRLIESIKDKMKNENITISVGVSIYPIHGLTKGKLIQAADSACFEAKREGGCRYKIWGQS